MISNFNQQLLYNKQKELDLVDNAYLTDTTNPNFIYVKDKFFDTEDTEKAQLLNVGSMLFKTVSDTIAFYVDQPDGEVEYNPRQSVENLFANGYMLIGLEMNQGKLIIKDMPTKDHYYDDELNADVIVRLYKKAIGDDINETLFLLKTIYYEKRIENKLYQLQTDSYDSGTEVGLDTLNETSGLVPVETTPYKPLYTLKRDNRVQYPNPEIEQIKSIVYSIDRKEVMFETQFLKHTENITLFRNIKPSNLARAKDIKNGGVKYKQIKDDIQFTDDPAAGIEFVNNTNELLKDAIDYVEKQTRRISAITSVPTDFLGLEASHGAIGQGSRTVLHGAFIRKIQSIRNLLDQLLPTLYEIVAKENGVLDDYSRPDVFVKDEKDLIEELKVAREMGIISQKKALMEYQGIPLDQAEEEILEIDGEKQKESDLNKVDFTI